MEKTLRVLTILLLLVTLARAQDDESKPKPLGDRQGEKGREQMWRAPTDEEWKKPVLITFQRTWDDALAVSRETGKAILICINMDGEIASEHYAGVRYRQPEVAKLYEPYVCVIASTYRHNPKDHDEDGHRILCPRFGSVTCGEHIDIEPILYEKYMDGQRVAPRHIMVELDGKETYDIFYAFDTASVFDAVRDGIAKRTNQPKPIVRGDRSIVERVASRDVVDRNAVEAAYAKGDAAQRAAILDAAQKHADKNQLDVLRLAVFGLDEGMSAKAREALAKASTPAATDLISEALRVPMKDDQRAALLGALEKIGEVSPKAKWLSTVHRGLGGRSKVLDVGAWEWKARAGYEASRAARTWDELEKARQASVDALEKSADAKTCLALAESSLDLARRAMADYAHDPRMATRYRRYLLEDARRAAMRAAEFDGPAWKIESILTLVEYNEDNREAAYKHAEKATKALPANEPSADTMAVVTIFAEGRWEAIKAALDADEKWPPEWLTDLNAAYSVLRKHPHGTDAQVVWHLDVLEWLGHWRESHRVLREGIERFPDSSALHSRLRKQLLRSRRGPAALEREYSTLLEKREDSPELEWYAGYASYAAAEQYRRMRSSERARAAYGRAIERYAELAKSSKLYADSSNAQRALALAGRARIRMETDDLAGAVGDLIASIDLNVEGAGTLDGLGISPAMTGQSLLARLEEAKKPELADKLAKALSRVDPAALTADK